jgi:hypothetical protein
MARIEGIVIEEPAYDWLDFPFWAEAVSYGHKFHNFVAWLADTDAYLCAVVINRKAEFLSMLARIRDEIAALVETEKAAASPVVDRAQPVLPDPWIKIVDPATRTPYYYNMVSGKSQWEFPASEAAAPASPRSVASAKPCSSSSAQGTTRVSPKTGGSAKPYCRDPMARDPRRKQKRAAAAAAAAAAVEAAPAPQDLLHCPSLLLEKHQGVHVHRY